MAEQNRAAMRTLLTVLFFFISKQIFAQGTQLLRQPTASDTEIILVYANDLWKTAHNGGASLRLTSNARYESLPHFSPDGKTIAFTAEYDGNTDVYIIPSEDGGTKTVDVPPQ
jgi:tricorn protease